MDSKLKQYNLCHFSEVSDQNFVDEEVEGAAESSRACKRKRSRSPVYNLLNDQVINWI